MGFNFAELGQFKAAGKFIDGYPSDVATFYSPRDERIHEVIVSLLESAQHSLVMNHYGYDDDTADAVIRTKMQSEHVYVQMSLDKSQAGGVHEKELLAKWPSDAFGTSIAVGQSARHAISHLKVCIVDGIFLVTGSTNWSLSGEQKQDNQLTISQSPVLCAEARAILDANHNEMLRQMAASKTQGAPENPSS